MNKLLSGFYDSVKSGEVELGDGQVDECITEMDRLFDLAKSTILEKMPEGDVVKTMLIVQKFVSGIGASQGKAGILMAEMDGSLQGYTHTVVLTTIGLLMDEEVL